VIVWLIDCLSNIWYTSGRFMTKPRSQTVRKCWRYQRGNQKPWRTDNAMAKRKRIKWQTATKHYTENSRLRNVNLSKQMVNWSAVEAQAVQNYLGKMLRCDYSMEECFWLPQVENEDIMDTVRKKCHQVPVMTRYCSLGAAASCMLCAKSYALFKFTRCCLVL
jgi:hypothetical protein